MSDNTYNTSHGNFLIEARKVPHVIEALCAYDFETSSIVDPSVFSSIEASFAHFDLECVVTPEGDITDVYLAKAYFGDSIMKVLTEVIAPFVSDGSFLVFYQDICFAVYYEKNRETDKVEGHMGNVITVLDQDLARMLLALSAIGSPLFDELKHKYALSSTYLAAAAVPK